MRRPRMVTVTVVTIREAFGKGRADGRGISRVSILMRSAGLGNAGIF